MLLASFLPRGERGRHGRLGVVLAGVPEQLLLDASSVSGLPATMSDLLDNWDAHFSRLLAAVEEISRKQPAEGSEALLWPLSDVTLLPPVPRPTKIVCMGFNYAEHLEEGETFAASNFPTAFLRSATCLRPHGARVPIPAPTSQFDYEVELAVVVGRGGKYIPEERAMEHVAGYTVFLDLSARDIQFPEMKQGMLLLGKNLDGTAPCGPWLVTADEIPDPHGLGIRCRVNGEERQASNTSHLIFKIPKLVSYWSQMRLEPGDIIATGTPAGVAAFRKPDPTPFYLKPGDVVEAEVERVGVLRVEIGERERW